MEMFAKDQIGHGLRPREASGHQPGRSGSAHRGGEKLVPPDKNRPRHSRDSEPAGDTLQPPGDHAVKLPPQVRISGRQGIDDDGLLHRKVVRQQGRARSAVLAAAAVGFASLCRRRERRTFLFRLQGQFGLASGGRRRSLFAAFSKDITRQRRQLPRHHRQLLPQPGALLLKLRDAPLLISGLPAGGFKAGHAVFL